jgi:hypothetical protein
VKEVFELIAQRTYSTEIIRLMMKEKGLVDKGGNAVNRSYFFRLIRNPLYKGLLTQFGKLTQGCYEPLVAIDLFDHVQAILKGRKNKVKHYLKENPDFPVIGPRGNTKNILTTLFICLERQSEKRYLKKSLWFF